MAAVLRGPRFVTDGGLETDLIFHHGVDLPQFAAFVLLDDAEGRRMLRDYYAGYAEVARRHRAALRLETPTWRASSDWGALLGYSPADLERVNHDAIALMRQVRADHADIEDVQVVGMIGPRGDGYRPGAWDPRTGVSDAESYHHAQIAALADAGADAVAACTLTDAAEAIGIVLAARSAGVRIEISFTVETDGGLASGRSLADTVREVEHAAAPDGYLLNCAHPEHIANALTQDLPVTRVIGLRPNASRLSHAELDESDHLDDGDPDELAAAVGDLLASLPAVQIVGGCCGTDARHVEAMWRAISDPPVR